MVRRKIMKNVLNKYLNEELKAKPHYIEKEHWVMVKAVLNEFKSTLTNEILTEQELATCLNFMMFSMEGLREICDDTQYKDCKEHIYGLINHYLEWSAQLELYECSYNIKFVQDLLLIKIKIQK